VYLNSEGHIMNMTRFFRSIVTNARPRFQAMQQLVATAFVGTWVTLVDGATPTPDCALGNFFTMPCVNNNARAIAVPANMVAGDSIQIKIVNTSGGALNATTFAAAIKQPAITYPATANHRMYYLISDGATVSLVGFSAADIPN
jgi:hypothetical protein